MIPMTDDRSWGGEQSRTWHGHEGVCLIRLAYTTPISILELGYLSLLCGTALRCLAIMRNPTWEHGMRYSYLRKLQYVSSSEIRDAVIKSGVT